MTRDALLVNSNRNNAKAVDYDILSIHPSIYPFEIDPFIRDPQDKILLTIH